MSLQLSEKVNNISGNDKPDLGGSGLVVGPGETELFTDDSILPRAPNLHKGSSLNSEDNFLKLIRGERAEWLQSHYPNAFLLLIVIALRAKRSADPISGLEAGDSIVDRKGTAKAAGITEDQFRYALDRLVKLNLIEVVFNPKVTKPQKRPIKIPMKSTVVNLLNSEVCDINRKEVPHDFPHLVPINSPSIPHKQERIRKNKKEKEEERISSHPLKKTEVRFDRSIGEFAGIDESLIELWKQSYPGLTLEPEFAKMKEWLSRPKNKRRKGDRSFISAWLQRSFNDKQDFLIEGVSNAKPQRNDPKSEADEPRKHRGLVFTNLPEGRSNV